MALVQSIHYGQYLWIKHNCSNEQDFEREALALRNRLLLGGYSKKIVKKTLHHSCNILVAHTWLFLTPTRICMVHLHVEQIIFICRL